MCPTLELLNPTVERICPCVEPTCSYVGNFFKGKI